MRPQGRLCGPCGPCAGLQRPTAPRRHQGDRGRIKARLTDEAGQGWRAWRSFACRCLDLQHPERDSGGRSRRLDHGCLSRRSHHVETHHVAASCPDQPCYPPQPHATCHKEAERLADTPRGRAACRPEARSAESPLRSTPRRQHGIALQSEHLRPLRLRDTQRPEEHPSPSCIRSIYIGMKAHRGVLSKKVDEGSKTTQIVPTGCSTSYRRQSGTMAVVDVTDGLATMDQIRD
jgi:hypothetical protein